MKKTNLCIAVIVIVFLVGCINNEKQHENFQRKIDSIENSHTIKIASIKSTYNSKIDSIEKKNAGPVVRYSFAEKGETFNAFFRDMKEDKKGTYLELVPYKGNVAVGDSIYLHDLDYDDPSQRVGIGAHWVTVFQKNENIPSVFVRSR